MDTVKDQKGKIQRNNGIEFSIAANRNLINETEMRVSQKLPDKSNDSADKKEKVNQHYCITNKKLNTIL